MSTVPVRERPPPRDADPSLDPRRAEAQACLREAEALPGIDATSCRWLEEKLASEVFNLVVAGEFKRGKSSVINALLGEPLLPTGVVPLTSTVTIIRSGRTAAARVELGDGQCIAIEPAALADYVTERGNPHNAKGVERVLVDHPSPWLQNGVRLVDTPGIGSVYEHNTDETRKYLPQADAVLFVASVEQPVSRAELQFLRDIRSYAGKTFCVLNKTDHLGPEELAESLAFATTAVRDALGVAVPVFPISARLALEGKQSHRPETVSRSGYGELESALGRFMRTEKTDAWLRSIASALERLLAQARFALDLEAKVLHDPLERIEASLAVFRQEKNKAERARADYRVLLHADTRALLGDRIEPSLETFKREQQEGVAEWTLRTLGELEGLPSRRLEAALRERLIAHVRAGYDGWLVGQNVEIALAFDALCARFWTSLEESVDELMRRSSELFGIGFEPIHAESRWTSDSGFYYKFWYEPTSLKLLASSAVFALPRRLAQPIIVKRTQALGADLIEIQAGRLRHDLHERLAQSVRDAERQMMAQIEATIAHIETAIEGGLAARRRSSEHAGARGGQLAESRRQIAALDARLGAIISPAAQDGPHR
ncbi:MAG: dynamin family protein [Steroidobacteraceae bacterium]